MFLGENELIFVVDYQDFGDELLGGVLIFVFD